MNKHLFLQAITKFTAGVLLVGLLLFLPAGTLRYPHGWLFMALLFGPMFLAGLFMMKKSPNLLRSRLKAKETQGEQKTVIALSGLMFMAGFLLCGFNHRFGWHTLPRPIVVGAAILFLLAYALYAEVLRENMWLSRTIEVQENQKVVDTGLYGIVRHPMYAVTLLLFLSMPLVLGSIHAFLVFLAYPVIIGKRLLAEETFLEEHLPGYREYKQKVRYRLLPFIW